MTQMKTGGGMAVKTCANNPIAAQFKLGESLGVNGTPAIFTPDGTLLPGFMPAAELAATLGITAPAAAAPNGN
jgi:thiol:disulfide interchange protein DsbC